MAHVDVDVYFYPLIFTHVCICRVRRCVPVFFLHKKD